MGRVARLLSFARITRGDASLSEATVDPGGGANVTSEHFSTPGDDSQPLPSDYVLLVPISGAGRMSVAGYLDPVNGGQAGPGEKRIYARDSSGDIVCSIWLKSGGAVEVANSAGEFTLAADGSVDINGVTIDTSGNITTPGTVDASAVEAASVVAGGLELTLHTHLAGTPPGTTGPNQ